MMNPVSKTYLLGKRFLIGERAVKLSLISFSGSLKVILRSEQVQIDSTMKVYVENKANNVCDASATTAKEQDYRKQHQDLQIAPQLELEAERNQLVNIRALKATNGNVAKWLKLR